MKINSAELSGFRNIKHESFEFCDSVNIIYGDNGQGKTNLAEALFYFANGRSFRNATPAQLINYDENSAYVKINITSGLRSSDKNSSPSNSILRTDDIKMQFARGFRRAIYLNGVKIERYSEYLGRIKMVLFTPEHLRLVKDGPSERRSFIDAAISQIKPVYIAYLEDYNKKIEHRNALLKSYRINNRKEDVQIAVWDRAIVETAVRIIIFRYEYVKLLNEAGALAYREISGSREIMEIEYRSNILSNIPDGYENPDPENIRLAYHTLLEKSLESDIRNGNTHYGIHKDDVYITVNGRDARDYASQGQQRSCVLALKVAEGDISARTNNGDYPIFIFDDVLSELDSYRRYALLKRMKGKQLFVTACDRLDDFSFLGYKFLMKDGHVESFTKRL